MKETRAGDSNAKFLFLSMLNEHLFAERVLRAGALGYLMKNVGGEDIVAAVKLILNGEIAVSKEVTSRIMQSLSSGAKSQFPLQSLSDRELEVFIAIGQGKSTKEIALELGVSVKTVETHRDRIKDKLTIKDGTTLVKQAVEFVASSGSSLE